MMLVSTEKLKDNDVFTYAFKVSVPNTFKVLKKTVTIEIVILREVSLTALQQHLPQ